MTAPSPVLIDESTDFVTPARYDPLREKKFEQYIQISERVNPGRRQFNNFVQPTNDVQVIGLVLSWSGAIDSRLRALSDRTNVERLRLYADTVIIDTPLKFPGTSVTIHARRLIVGTKGSIDTTPLRFAAPASGGTGPNKMKAGADANDAGDVTLLVHSTEIAAGKPRFIMNGSAGQAGQVGGQRDDQPTNEIGLHWDTIKDKFIAHDVWQGTEDSWNFLPELKTLAQNGQIYWLRLRVRNSWKDPVEISMEMGDKTATNRSNGADAYPSGNGGNGGRGGTLRSIGGVVGRDLVVQNGGAGGESPSVSGGPVRPNAKTRVHAQFNVCHRSKGSCSEGTNLRSENFPGGWIVSWMDAAPGKSAKGADGSDGAGGKTERVDDAQAWLHAYVVEPVLRYVRETWLAGDRRPARWLLPIYQTALANAESANSTVTRDHVLANFAQDINRMRLRVDANLDYFGNPVGWVPRLGALTTIKMLKLSRPAIAKLLFYSGRLAFADQKAQDTEANLAFLAEELTAQIDSARAELVAAQEQLPAAQAELSAISAKLEQQVWTLADYDAKATSELAQQEREQAAYRGVCKIVGGACSFIPVGQPFVGAIAGGLADSISEIDIHDPSFVKIVKTAGGAVETLGEFVGTYENEITKDMTRGIQKQIDDAQGSIKTLSEQIDDHKSELEMSRAEVESRFDPDELHILRTRVEKLREAKSTDEVAFYSSDEYTDVIRHVSYLEENLGTMEVESAPVDDARKVQLRTKLAAMKKEKKDLIAKVEKRTKAKEERGEDVARAAKTIQQVGKGIGGVAKGLQDIMTPVDTSTDEFQAKLAVLKGTKYETELAEVHKDVAELNAQRLKAANRVIKLQATIATACQTIATNLIERSELSDERARSAEKQLQPMTRLFLRRTAQDAWDLLRAEMYYLVKSYQYRFLRRADPEAFNVERLITDINNFMAEKKTGAPKEEHFKEAFDAVIQSVFQRMALDLLTNRTQLLPELRESRWVVKMTPETRTNDGVNVLEHLSQRKPVSFRLHALGPDSKGTGDEFYYRLKNITFLKVGVSFDEETKASFPGIESRASFRVTLAHSGDSVIRAENGERYFFTTRNPDGGELIVDNVRSWSATYNCADVQPAIGSIGLSSDLSSEISIDAIGIDTDDTTVGAVASGNGITNDRVSRSDSKVLTQLLVDLDSGDDLEYEEHLPGATSVLTLAIDDNKLGAAFEITELCFAVDYELMPSAVSGSLPRQEGRQRAGVG
jgi:hypothetical protein